AAIALSDGVAAPYTTTAGAGGAWTVEYPTAADGTYTFTARATDLAGNAGDASTLTLLRDTTPPALVLPADVTAEAVSAAGATVPYAAATATDATAVTLAYSQASGTVFPLGTTTVHVTATDAAGNATSGDFAVTVRDTTAPVVTVPADVTAEATSP